MYTKCRTGLIFRVSMTHIYRGLIGQVISGLGVSDGSLDAGTAMFCMLISSSNVVSL